MLSEMQGPVFKSGWCWDTLAFLPHLDTSLTLQGMLMTVSSSFSTSLSLVSMSCASLMASSPRTETEMARSERRAAYDEISNRHTTGVSHDEDTTPMSSSMAKCPAAKVETSQCLPWILETTDRPRPKKLKVLFYHNSAQITCRGHSCCFYSLK